MLANGRPKGTDETGKHTDKIRKKGKSVRGGVVEKWHPSREAVGDERITRRGCRPLTSAAVPMDAIVIGYRVE